MGNPEDQFSNNEAHLIFTVCRVSSGSILFAKNPTRTPGPEVRNLFSCSTQLGMKFNMLLKGTATLMISMFYIKELYEPWILIPVSSQSVDKYGSCGHLNIYKWTLMEAAILYA